MYPWCIRTVIDAEVLVSENDSFRRSTYEELGWLHWNFEVTEIEKIEQNRETNLKIVKIVSKQFTHLDLTQITPFCMLWLDIKYRKNTHVERHEEVMKLYSFFFHISNKSEILKHNRAYHKCAEKVVAPIIYQLNQMNTVTFCILSSPTLMR